MSRSAFPLFLTAFCFSMAMPSQAQTNLALKASVSTSFVSSWEKLGAVNDGKIPANSSDKSNGAYGNWNGEGDYHTWNWVQYEWTNAQNIKSSEVYWWDDGGGIDQPTQAYIEYWNGNSWMRAGDISVALNRFNTLTRDLWTNKIRINMISLMATGILEWRVMGTESGPCDPTVLTSFLRINGNGLVQTNTANVLVGDSIQFDPLPAEGGAWSWSGPDGFTASARQLTIRNIQTSQSGCYTATFMNSCGAFSSQNFYVTVSTSDDGDVYDWPDFHPALNYNFRDEFPALQMPTRDLNDCPQVVGSQSSGWWTFKWGPKANSLVTPAAITPMLARMNTEFAYFRDVMGWPPDKRAKRGYRSAIYLYGSGLCTDDASNTELGGWQSAINYQGENWPMVLASYYPVYCFDPSCLYNDRAYQTGGMVHEGIHSILADLPGCKNAAWFQEGGNTWLQQEAESIRSGDYNSMGFLNACPFIAPFMPIECYSGWLQDDTFGGPSAEGVDRYNGNQQLCTWRNLLGGNQYGNTFPTFLGQTLGTGSIAWIWRYCPSRVLDGIADSLGDSQTRRLIMEYRAKQTLLDMGPWTGAIKKLIDNNFKSEIKAEWQPSWLNPKVWIATPYTKTTNDGNGLLTPEYRTTPGWSGANQVPLFIEGDTVVVNFQPLGANMTCQLCYRTKDGTTVYSQPVFGGNCILRLDKRPANSVVFAVVCNTDYEYNGETTRTAHFEYRLQLVKGAVRAANIYVKWYDWVQDLKDINSGTDNIPAAGIETLIYPNPLDSKAGLLNMRYMNPDNDAATLEISDSQGRVVYWHSIQGDLSINTTGFLTPGFYMITVKTPAIRRTYKLIVI